MKKGCIYYTCNSHPIKIDEACRKQLRESFDGEIVCVSLKPMDFGDKRIVMKDGVKSYPTMVDQILIALENSSADQVFFTESDVLYHPSHFDFNITRDDIYYYNINNWRWRWETDVAIHYDALHSLSGMTCNRETAIKHYKIRKEHCKKNELSERRAREPRWARKFGYEPGTKKIRRGGITDEDFEVWRSELPNIDIRHKGTFSHPKTFLHDFNHLPEDWKETNVFDIPGWDLKKMFNL